MAKKRFFDYQGRDVLVRYEPKRCIHAQQCIKGLPAVFDRHRKPWIDPDQALADAVVEVVTRCPAGALHFERRDGGPPETALDRNTARPVPNGPLYLQGRLRISFSDGRSIEETRVALCRCGASTDKPFCDNSHEGSGFRDRGEFSLAMLAPGEGRGPLHISEVPNGPLVVEGPLTIHSADAAQTHSGVKGALCRCGASQSKPYCDGSHVAAGFETD